MPGYWPNSCLNHSSITKISVPCCAFVSPRAWLYPWVKINSLIQTHAQSGKCTKSSQTLSIVDISWNVCHEAINERFFSQITDWWYVILVYLRHTIFLTSYSTTPWDAVAAQNYIAHHANVWYSPVLQFSFQNKNLVLLKSWLGRLWGILMIHRSLCCDK